MWIIDMYKQLVTVILSVILIAGCAGERNNEWKEFNGVDFVVVIGVDGLSPDGIRTADTPYIDYLIEYGASTLDARAVMPTVSSPNWASMIMGAGPEQHGVTSNSWRYDNFEITPTETGQGGFFPTIFSLMYEQRKGLKTSVFYDWPGIANLFEYDLVDFTYSPDLPRDDTEDRVKRSEDTMENAISHLEEVQPGLMFIQLDHVDHFGHRFAHGSDEYYKSVQLADSLIGNMIAAIEDAGLQERTVIHISSDHGGIDYGHGGATDEEILIPWIIYGPEVIAGKELGPFINIYDTAATIAYIFGIETPDGWIARPVKHAFVDD